MFGGAGDQVGRVGREDVHFQFFVATSGVYDDGLFAFATDEEGNLISTSSFGMDATLGITGRQRWRRSVLALSYRGDYSHYTTQSYYNGFNQALNLSYGKLLSARWELVSSVAAGITNRAIGAYTNILYNPGDYPSVPYNELFNNPTAYAEAQVRAAYRVDARSSVFLGGSGFVVRRRAEGLIGSEGYVASGGYGRRITRTTTLGGNYGYTHYQFAKSYGTSDMHTGTVTLGQQIGRNWSFGLAASLWRVESIGLTQVTLDPIVAAILGQNVGTEAFYLVTYMPGYSGKLSRTFRRATLTVGAHQGVNPGNGIYLTTKDRGVTANYTHQVGKWNLGANAGYGKWTSLARALPGFRNLYAGFGISRQLVPHLGFNVRADYRDFQGSTGVNARDAYRVSVGLVFTPSEDPVVMW